VRELDQDFRDVYDIVTLIGKGSISNIYKIQKKESAIGGSSRLSDSSTSSETHISEKTKRGITIFALKEIDTAFLEEGCGEELENEIDLLKGLDHPNIIKVRALGCKLRFTNRFANVTSAFSVLRFRLLGL
jgi:serine/threonine protein kinase